MIFEDWHREIIKAKKEYDGRINPILKVLEKAKVKGWEIYLKRITKINTNLTL